MIKIVTGWIDTAGRTRTWALIDSKDGKLGEVTTKRAAYALKRRLEAHTGPTNAVATFTLHLTPTAEGWALVDNTGRARACSPNRDLLTENVAAIGDALIEAAQMASRLAETGIVMSDSVTWAVRA